MQAAHDALAIVAAGHRLALGRHEQDVFVEVEFGRNFLREFEFALGAEALHLIDIKRDRLVAIVIGGGLGDLVVEVVLRLQAHRAGLELHVDILGDEDGRRRKGLLDKERAGDDAIVLLGEIGQHGAQPLHGRRRPIVLDEIAVDNDGQRAAVGQLHTLVHGAGVRQELLEDAVHPAGIAAALGGLLAFYRIELLENLDRNGQVIVLELEDRLRIVQQNVRVQNVGLGPYFDLMLRWILHRAYCVFHRVDNL